MAVLLVIIYVSFISLGLPDSLLGSAWPSMYAGLGVPIASAGILSMIIAGGTIVSSFFSERVIRRLGTGRVTLISVAMTALALLGFSLSGRFALLCLWAVPLGLGAGSVDAALNNYVALHYRARHMNWLHCFWGIGASLGPVIMALCLGRWGSWQAGYRAIGVLQTALVAVLLLSQPLWKKAQRDAPTQADAMEQRPLRLKGLLRLPGAKPTLIAFFCYCALETTVGLWGSSYLVTHRGIAAQTAASWISLYYLGITLGRFISGFLSMRLAHRQMVHIGQDCIALGVALLMLPVPDWLLLAALFSIGLGCAPIFPSLLHETPANFGSRHSQAIMGIQMACAYLGATFMPPLFGALGSRFGYGLFPYYLAVLLALMIGMVLLLYARIGRARAGDGV